jgi:bifunctional UDP-N-acetylglucosamine pyrophosphorylase / glucosamine-1-phosphate N-acetyltransferase
MKLAVVVLAAGFGRRMKSSIPKVLHPLLGRPIIRYVLDAVSELSPVQTVLVVGYGAEQVRDLGTKGIKHAHQKEQLGTGHAASCARGELSKFKGNVLIVNGDFPLITSKSLKKFLGAHEKSGSKLSVLTATVDDPKGYGRIVRDEKGILDCIVEEKDSSPEQRKINEINSGTYLVNSDLLWSLLRAIKSRNKQREYYLTDIIEIARKRKVAVSAFKLPGSNEVLGVNDRAQLSQIEHIMRARVNDTLMKSGVTIIDPGSTYISPEAAIGRDTVIYPGTHIYGQTRIGRGSVIGPHVWIEDSNIGNSVKVRASCYITNARVEDAVTVGPFAHLRPEADIKHGAKIGNFVEIKKSTVGQGSKVPHLSYVGDATLGKDVNIGAGTITCNYDGFNKHRTDISDGVFIGSDTMLVAPVKVGKGAVTGAGSTITKDVPEGALAISRARQTVIENWRKKPKEKSSKNKSTAHRKQKPSGTNKTSGVKSARGKK